MTDTLNYMPTLAFFGCWFFDYHLEVNHVNTFCGSLVLHLFYFMFWIFVLFIDTFINLSAT
jgi:hypothetical protein